MPINTMTALRNIIEILFIMILELCCKHNKLLLINNKYLSFLGNIEKVRPEKKFL